LFRGSSAVTYEAGDVVHVLGGPYDIAGDYAVSLNGSERAPVVIVGKAGSRVRFDGGGSRVDFSWDGAYGVVEGLDFYHQTRHVIDGHHLALRSVGILNPPEARIDFNPVVGLRGHDLVIAGCEIGNNRRDNDTDSHGINAGEGSYNLWILDNEILRT
jgi:hypothetical protein